MDSTPLRLGRTSWVVNNGWTHGTHHRHPWLGGALPAAPGSGVAAKNTSVASD